MKLKFSGNAYLVDSSNGKDFKEIDEPSLTALGGLDWNDPFGFLKLDKTRVK